MNLFILAIFLAATPSWADNGEDAGGLFGDWAGVKPAFNEKGILIEAAYKGEYIENLSGGIKEDSGFLGNLDLKAEIDLEKTISLPGTKLFLYALGDHGDDPTEFVGDSFATSNIESPNALKLYEAYLEKTFGQIFVLSFGARDLNAEYYVTETSGLFANSAFGISPALSQTGVNGPSIFPTTSIALNAIYKSPTAFYVQAGIFNAQAGDPKHAYETHFETDNSEGYLDIAEIGFSDSTDKGPRKYAVGFWSYTKETERIDLNGSDKNWGAYVLFDQRITSQLSFFLRHGLSEESVNTFAGATEIGFVYTGLLSGRESDKLGLGYATGKVSDDFVAANSSEKFESVAELCYEIDVLSGFSLIPDYQKVINPGLDKERKNASVLGLRAIVSF